MKITRTPSGKNFVYCASGKKIVSKSVLERIKKLHIPPNWKSVEISDSTTDYLQATGSDDKGRTQYIYHPMWVELSKIEKWGTLAEFAKKLPLLTKHVKQKLSGEIDLSDREYLIALMFRILNKTHARIGNECYSNEKSVAKQPTYGLTTLKKKHLVIKGSVIHLKFVGKKGVKQDLSFKDPVCLKALKELRKLPGDDLFPISSTEMNEYLKSVMGDDFTCKDFRTHASNVLFLKILCKQEAPTSMTGSKRTLNSVYDQVAEKLGHTRAISKKSYVMPVIAEQFLENPGKFIGGNPTKILKDLLKDY